MEDDKIVTVYAKSSDIGDIHKAVARVYAYPKVINLGTGLFGILHIALVLLKVKYCRGRVVFFHECCWPIFDILHNIIGPNSDFRPQVHLSSFVRLSYDEYMDGKPAWKDIFFRLIGLRSRFNFWIADTDNNMRFKCVSSREYPKNTVLHSVNSRRASPSHLLSNQSKCGNVLFLLGRDACPDMVCRQVYFKAVDVMNSYGYLCYFKNHPSKSSQLILPYIEGTIIDPDLPAELIDIDFSWVVGIASSALAYFGLRSVSLVNLAIIDSDARRNRKTHLESLDPNGDIHYPTSWEEMSDLVKL